MKRYLLYAGVVMKLSMPTIMFAPVAGGPEFFNGTPQEHEREEYCWLAITGRLEALKDAQEKDGFLYGQDSAGRNLAHLVAVARCPLSTLKGVESCGVSFDKPDNGGRKPVDYLSPRTKKLFEQNKTKALPALCFTSKRKSFFYQ